MPCNVLETRKEVFNHFRYVQQLKTITNIPTVWKIIKIVKDDLQQIRNKATIPNLETVTVAKKIKSQGSK